MKRTTIFMTLIGICLMIFWTQFRYPALDRKALMGKEQKIGDALSFDVAYPVDPAAPPVQRIFTSTLNWIHTNTQGMIFGLVLATLILSLFQGWKLKPTGNSVLDSALGTAIGAPLGVCANCATPIAKGLLTSGSGLVLAIATIAASPVLNLVVVSTSLWMLPKYLAYLRIGGILVYLLILLPFCARFFFKRERLQHDGIPCPINSPLPFQLPQPQRESWPAALLASGKIILQSALYIGYTTIPAMLLAGFLGIVIVYFVPIDSLFPREFSLWSLLKVSTVATLLPVPIYFDLLFSHLMFTGGARASYVAAMFLGLGAFSIYPFIILWRNLSARVAFTILMVMIGLAFVVGLLGELYYTSTLLQYL